MGKGVKSEDNNLVGDFGVEYENIKYKESKLYKEENKLIQLLHNENEDIRIDYSVNGKETSLELEYKVSNYKTKEDVYNIYDKLFKLVEENIKTQNYMLELLVDFTSKKGYSLYIDRGTILEDVEGMELMFITKNTQLEDLEVVKY